MKIFLSYKFSLWIAACLVSTILFTSCSKKDAGDADAPVVLSTEQYIRYTVNGPEYSYEKPKDLVEADTITGNPALVNLDEVLGDRIPAGFATYTRIRYADNDLMAGSMQTLNTFYTPQTGGYYNNAAGFLTAPAPIKVRITEYGTIGQYIAGNFTAVFTGPSPANTRYDVTCSFRVKRRI